MTLTKGRGKIRGDNDYKKYDPAHPESEAAVASSNSDQKIPFAFGGK